PPPRRNAPPLELALLWQALEPRVHPKRKKAPQQGWLERLQTGRRLAAQHLPGGISPWLMRYARNRLLAHPPDATGEGVRDLVLLLVMLETALLTHPEVEKRLAKAEPGKKRRDALEAALLEAAVAFARVTEHGGSPLEAARWDRLTPAGLSLSPAGQGAWLSRWLEPPSC
ncbi:MAG: hypothetical protein HQL51_06695, partial [Magnetococcales bacterium]|nr:hypothetical protein [Magnetococcales bacterium]